MTKDNKILANNQISPIIDLKRQKKGQRIKWHKEECSQKQLYQAMPS